MAIIKKATHVFVEAKATIELNEKEMEALLALVGYGTDKFLEVFYEKLGSHYLKPNESELRNLFEEIRLTFPGILSFANQGRDALQKLAVRVDNPLGQLCQRCKVKLEEEGE